jgi:predicted nucleic acid-binding protein
VSALISKNPESATIKVMRHLFACDFIPLINDDIISEYEDVLSRAKFNLSSDVVSDLLSIFRLFGEEVERTIKHFPITPRVVTPAEFLNILYS